MNQEALAFAIIAATKTIALVGASPNPQRDSHMVMAYLLRNSFKVMPVNPMVPEVLGQIAVGNLRDVKVPIDTVVCFRRSEEIDVIAAEALVIGAKHLWMQLDVVNQVARALAEAGGMKVVMDRCIMVDHRAYCARRQN